MTNICLYCRHRPILNSEYTRHPIKNFGLANPVLRRAGTMGLHHGAALNRLIADNRAGRCDRFRHGDVVTRPRCGDGFLVAIGIDKYIVDRTVNIRPQLQGQGVVHQHHVSTGLGDGKTAILTKWPPGPPQMRGSDAIELPQPDFLRPHTHRGLPPPTPGPGRRPSTPRKYWPRRW